MAKRCCGVIYSDNESVCKICGKSLSDAEIVDYSDDDIVNTMDKDMLVSDTLESDKLIKDVEEIVNDSLGNKSIESKESVKNTEQETAPMGLKAVGIISLVVALLGIGVVYLLVHGLMLSPSYVKDDMTGKELIFPELATESDADLYVVRTALSTATDATVTDAQTESDAVVE